MARTMQYNGGKGSCAKELAYLLRSRSGPAMSYWEPFCGACNVIAELPYFPWRIASDLDLSIISLLEAVQMGWEPPVSVSEEEYQRVRNEVDESEPLHAFCKYGCSFGGKPWGGYARSGDRNYAMNARNSLLKQASKLRAVQFISGAYDEVKVDADIIYCDPPYKGTTQVGAGGKFDTSAFWDWVRNRSKESMVFVSELFAPEDFEEIWSKKLNDGLGARKITEKLFVWKRGNR